VLVGHCTRNDCAPAGSDNNANRIAGNPRRTNWKLIM